MKTAIFLWIVITGSAEDHWQRFPMPDLLTCNIALKSVKTDIPAGPKQVNGLVAFCAGEREMHWTDNTWRPS